MPGSSRSADGSGWVVAQFALMALILVLGFLPGDWPGWFRVAGLVALGIGVAGFVWSVRALGPSLTPHPRPPEGAVLVERGPYRLVRHPIYLAGALLFLGAAVAASIPATAAALLLPVLWHFKAGVEERHLAQRFPAYADYAERVPRGV
jgi:protein-S-isoprenylcysteine O-methyltransferase Ste14